MANYDYRKMKYVLFVIYICSSGVASFRTKCENGKKKTKKSKKTMNARLKLSQQLAVPLILKAFFNNLKNDELHTQIIENVVSSYKLSTLYIMPCRQRQHINQVPTTNHFGVIIFCLYIAIQIIYPEYIIILMCAYLHKHAYTLKPLKVRISTIIMIRFSYIVAV